MRSAHSEKIKITIIIPALNEEGSVGQVVQQFLNLDSELFTITTVIIVDNGSCDNTAQVARAAGAFVVHEPEQGYGAACLRGIDSIKDADFVAFADADGSDFPEDLETMMQVCVKQKADLVVGSRVDAAKKNGSLPFHQRFGNKLAAGILGSFFSIRLTDLGPFRVIRYSMLKDIQMADRGFGWTVEMELKVLANKGRLIEVPVQYQKRIAGSSKISGTVLGSLTAGIVILRTLLKGFFTTGIWRNYGSYSHTKP